MECTDNASIAIMPTAPKRKRSPNWELTEKALLKECIKDYIGDIENKAVDTNTTKSKQRAYLNIYVSYFRFTELNLWERSLSDIKQQWRTMKLDAKKCLYDYKKSCKLTGGGEKPPSRNLDTQTVLSLIPQEFEEETRFCCLSISKKFVFDSDGQQNLVKTIVIEPENITAPLENSTKQQEISDVDQKSQTCNDEPKRTQENKYSTNNLKKKISKHKFNRKKVVNNEMSRRDAILTECIRAESGSKIQQMIETHEWARKEHLLRLKNLELENKILSSKLEK